ncbi:hypothetical protein LJR045_002255 [Microbacterium sp. LjRoot45]|uniref:hypothetical protein n=1 Tax=Microbacterium sp. LjRoot45 TaxID=3342329 RepID=UPI003ECE5709
MAAWIATAVLAALATLQIAVAAGAPWGRLVWGGAHRVLPRRLRVGSAVSVVIYAAFAAVLLLRSGAVSGGLAGGAGSPVIEGAAWVMVAYFGLGILVNLASRSVPERAVMAPTCLVLAGTTLIVALA